MPYFGAYVSDAGAQALHRYKYKGRDESLLLTHVTDAWFSRWVLYFPTWLAPNLITLTGFSFTAVGHALMWHYCPILQGPIPPWVCVYNAVAVLAYQAFDAMDGKQARRTKSGSPLGLLFDHGCDALNTTVILLNTACAMQLGPTPEVACLAICSWVGFFAGTLEEYYTGELYLGYINMPNEGLLCAAIVYLMAAVLPIDFWSTPVPLLGWRLNLTLVGFTAVLTGITVAANVYNIMAATLRKRRAEHARVNGRRRLTMHELQESSWWVAATRVTPTAVLFTAFVAWIVLSPSAILTRRPRLMLWAMGVTNSKLVTGIMLAHICEQEYHPWCRTIACSTTLLVHLFVQIARQRRGLVTFDAAEEDLMLFEIFGLVLAAYAHMVYSMVHEVSRALGIYCFTITSQRQDHTGSPPSPLLVPVKSPPQPTRHALSPAKDKENMRKRK